MEAIEAPVTPGALLVADLDCDSVKKELDGLNRVLDVLQDDTMQRRSDSCVLLMELAVLNNPQPNTLRYKLLEMIEEFEHVASKAAISPEVRQAMAEPRQEIDVFEGVNLDFDFLKAGGDDSKKADTKK